MAATKREREYARKRQEKWEQRQAQARARRQRTFAIVAIVAVLALVGGGFVVANLGGSANPAASPAPQAAGDCPAAQTGARSGGDQAPDPSVAADRTWTATLDLCTGAGESQVVVELDGAAAPQAVASFVSLADQGYFDGTACHRLTTQGIYVLQCGDPTGTGTGDPGYSYGPVENAPEDDVYPAGTVAMARQSNNGESMGSQFFIVYQDSTIPSDTAGGYTVLGTVTSGLDAVQAVADAGVEGGAGDGSPASPVIIEGVETQ